MITEKTITMKVPNVGESITEVTIAYWNKKSGDYVKKDEIIAEIESDKATFEINAESEGILKILAQEEVTLSVGSPICTITEKAMMEQFDEKNIEQNNANSIKDIKPASSPIAHKILSEKGIDFSKVQGTGAKGKIIKQDAILATLSTKKNKNISSPVINTVLETSKWNNNQNSTVMLTTFDEVNMESILQIKKNYKEAFQKKYGIELGLSLIHI